MGRRLQTYGTLWRRANLESAPMNQRSDDASWQSRVDGATWGFPSYLAMAREMAATNALGRVMRLGVAYRQQSTEPLRTAFQEVTDGILEFGPARLPTFEEIETVAERLRHDCELPAPRCEILIARVDSVHAQDPHGCLVDINLTPIDVPPKLIDVLSIPRIAHAGSALIGRPLDRSVEWRALQTRTPADDYLELDEDGEAIGFLGGSLVRIADVVLARVTDCGNVSLVRSLDGKVMIDGADHEDERAELERGLNARL